MKESCYLVVQLGPQYSDHTGRELVLSKTHVILVEYQGYCWKVRIYSHRLALHYLAPHLLQRKLT